jgi:hypothetical protein
MGAGQPPARAARTMLTIPCGMMTIRIGSILRLCRANDAAPSMVVADDGRMLWGSLRRMSGHSRRNRAPW